MANSEAVSLSRLCALHFASLLGNGRVPPIDAPFPPHVGDDIMEAMRDLSLLDETSLETFAQTDLDITKFDSSDCETLIPLQALHVLKKYKRLISINIANHDKNEMSPFNSLDIVQFVEKSLHPATAAILRHLNIAGYNKVRSLNGFGKLSSLESISLARRPIDTRWMTSAVKFLPQLRSLDISDTGVNELSWLSAIPNLEVLVMHNLEVKKGRSPNDLASLQKLRVLDISKKITDFGTDSGQESYVDLSSILVDTITNSPTSPWPELRSLDISGNALAGYGLDQAIQAVNIIMEKCPKIAVISVVATPLDTHTFNMEKRNVSIMNCCTKERAMEALKFYWEKDRDVFTSHALHAVYYSLQSSYDAFTEEEVIRCAQLVCSCMKKHIQNIGVQMAGSACLYHLCKLKRIRRLSPLLVQNCMNRCLDAAETWRQMVQLQKNVWLTICNDYLLQLPGVDFYRTCKVALESMLTSKDSAVARMTIAIVSIVTPKMRPPEARELTGDARYVKFLVGMLNENLRHLSSIRGDIPENMLFTLKFTLSALWNLTDESSQTCEVFHRAGGVATCFSILKSFDKHSNIQTKVLGILNNIAEVDELRHLLVENDEFIKILCTCLQGDYHLVDEHQRHRTVERSYFAAGVLSNLLAHHKVSGEISNENKELIDECLTLAVSNWPTLQGAMVSYRSFAPFERILEGTEFDGARLWCLWGVLHVLSNKEKSNGAPYPVMLKESSLPNICKTIMDKKASESLSYQLSEKILQLMNTPLPPVNEEDEQ